MRLRPNSFSFPEISTKEKSQRGLRCFAFTLIEMLVVLIIIALLAALALPHIRGHSESVAINAACRQLVDDLSFARQKAISQRSTVAMVFVPPSILGNTLSAPTYSTNEIALHKKLQGGVYTHYALYAFRRVGEQPGSGTRGYITEWKSLPEKTFIDPAMFMQGGLFSGLAGARRVEKFPFPLTRASVSGSTSLPYIAFDAEGRCVHLIDSLTGASTPDGDMEDIRIARGSILFTRQPNDTILPANYDVQQIPPFNATNNLIHIDYLTGRAKRIELELK